MIRIGVVEDDPASIDRILGHLDRYQRDHGERFHIGAFHDGADVLEDYRPDWDILLLDIQMPRVDGMTAARRIRERDSDVVIVFVTSAPQYAISGYEVDALSYLLKPVGYAAFEQELSRCLVRLRRRERRTLLFTDSEGDLHRIDLAEVLYIETVRRKLVIRSLERDYTVAGTLKSMEVELAGDDFFRCNSGYLVNLRHVTGVEGNDCRIRGGVRLQVSRPRKKEFLAALASYIGARGITA